MKGVFYKMRVLFATSEAYPYAASGGLGDVAFALPKALKKKNVRNMRWRKTMTEEHKND